MHPRDVAQEILDQNGTWTVSQMGSAGLDDLIWDVYPGYQRMSEQERTAFRDKVGKVFFG